MGGLAAIMCPNRTEVGAADRTLGVAVAAKANVTGGIVTPRMFQAPHWNPQGFGRPDSAAERRPSGSGASGCGTGPPTGPEQDGRALVAADHGDVVRDFSVSRRTS